MNRLDSEPDINKVVTEVFIRKPIYHKLTEDGRTIFIDGMSAFVKEAVENYGKGVKRFHIVPSDILNELDMIRQEGELGRVTTFREKLNEFLVPLKIRGTKHMVTLAVRYVFQDSLMMILNGVDTMADLKSVVSRSRRLSSAHQEGRQLHLMGALPPRTQVTTLRRAPKDYTPPTHL